MALTDCPKWVPDQKKPGTEIMLKDGRYYLYVYSSFYDKERKKTRKKTGKYLGSITEADGLVPVRRKMVASEAPPDKGFASERTSASLRRRGDVCGRNQAQRFPSGLQLSQKETTPAWTDISSMRGGESGTRISDGRIRKLRWAERRAVLSKSQE